MSIDIDISEITGSSPTHRAPGASGRRQVPVAPHETRAEVFQNSASALTESAPRNIQPGFTSSGKRIRAVRSHTRAVVEEPDGRLSYLNATEAGGSEVLQRALVLPSVKQIETGGWKELKARWASVTNARLAWTVMGSWDPYSQRLPEIVSCLCYEENGEQHQKIGARSNINIIFGSAVGDCMMADGLCPGSVKPEDACERLHGVTHQQRRQYWMDHPRVPRGSR
ncbi:hypothetical protein BJX66DRAFT_320199 [Aspergillus keveii]|uniref:Uncharacterized protein n=1 Tax=Aspergillus keveii TaxID=714993 RepID=A0ABR4FHC2_9EURO